MLFILIFVVTVVVVIIACCAKTGKVDREHRLHEEKHAKWLEERQRQFASELEQIPRVDVVTAPCAAEVGEPPELHMTSITKRTNIAKLFPLVVLDVETTGLSPASCEIIEVSAIKFDNGFVPVSCFTTLCKPRRPITAKITAINHITNEMVSDMPPFAEVAAPFSDYIAGCNVVGHNLQFDIDFLTANGVRFGDKTKFYDSLALARSLLVPSRKSDDWDVVDHKLTTLCNYYGVHRTDAHRSLSDCLATAKVFEKLIDAKKSK